MKRLWLPLTALIGLALLLVPGARAASFGAQVTIAVADTTPPAPLPFVQSVRIGPAPDLLPVERPICPHDSILVQIAGLFPNDCVALKDVQVLYVPTFAVGPPIVRLIVEHLCVRRLCSVNPVPWSARVVLPPLPAGNYGLPLQLGVVTCVDSVPPPDSLWATGIPFTVARDCPPPPQACLIGTFARPAEIVACDATVAPGHPAVLTFAVSSAVALSGLQGRFRMAPPGLHLTHLEPVGPAATMHLSWNPTPDGASFVLFADHGAPIPPTSGLSSPPVPLLRVTAELAPPPAAPAPTTFVHATDLLGSDADANGVPACPILDARMIDPSSARICLQRLCDFNGDAVIDVRDLVLMVHCLNGDGFCRDSSAMNCNGDAVFNLDDILCCAHRILEQGICPDCVSDSTATRREPSVKLFLGPPTGGSDDLALPLRLEGANRLGAARFALSYPADRYDVTSVEFPGGSPLWLGLSEVQGGEVVIGLIRTQDTVAPAGPPGSAIDVVVHLALKPGQTPGGQVQATAGDFSGPDGVKLEVEMGQPSQPLGGPARLSLSPSRPNPATGQARFTLTLDRPAAVTVGIYDVSGRLVAPLFSGDLAAGPREFVWNGARSGGGAAPNGIYFYRATSGGTRVSHKLVLLRGQ